MTVKNSLTKILLSNAAEEIYWRGLEYADSEKVKIISETEKKLMAVVAGTKIYDVEFRQGPKYIKGYCSCPYFASNGGEYCKHVVAVSIYYDRARKVPLPTDKDIESFTSKTDRGFWKKVDAMFNDPLNADLQLLAIASEYTPWGVRPHAKISVYPTLEDLEIPLTVTEVKEGLEKISKIMGRSSFDSYFCAGEISAVFSKTLDVVISRLKNTEKKNALKIFELCVVFYFEDYLQGIDGSDGVWAIPKARLPLIYNNLKEMSVSSSDFLKLREDLNKKIEGWGDIFEDLEIQI